MAPSRGITQIDDLRIEQPMSYGGGLYLMGYT